MSEKKPKKNELTSHIVSSIYILDELRSKVLLLKHKKLGVWLPPGGHIKGGEHPQASALREAFEETSIENITLLNFCAGDLPLQLKEQRQLQLSPELPQGIFPTAFALVEEQIPKTDSDEEHIHIDYVYVGQLNNFQEPRILKEEILEARWVLLQEQAIDQLDTFPSVKSILKKLAHIL